MGTAISKPLEEFSKEELAGAVASLGAKFKTYEGRLLENGVDGGLISSLSEAEVKETLEDLEVGNRLHRRVLVKEWKKALKATRELTSSDTKNTEVPSSADPVDPSATEAGDGKVAFRSEKYNYDPSTSAKDLKKYDECTDKLTSQFSNSHYNSVSLIVKDGQLSLSTRTRGENGVQNKGRYHYRTGESMCNQCLIDGSNRSFYFLEVPNEIMPPPKDETKGLFYSGHAIRNKEGKRIGMVCLVEENTKEKIVSEQREAFLKQLAENAAYQLQLRRALLERRSNLERQVAHLKTDRDDPIVLKANGQAPSVRKSQVKERLSQDTLYHYPSPLDEPDFDVTIPKNSRELPVMSDIQASQAQMKHLPDPDEYYAPADAIGYPRHPIAKTDMERCASTSSVNLKSLEPGSELATQIREYLKMISFIFGFAHVELNFQEPIHQFTLCAVDQDVALRQTFGSMALETVYESDKVTPFLQTFNRVTAPCNYPVATGKTFVVHDISQDASMKVFSDMGLPIHAYVGCPLQAPNGHTIGLVCMVDNKARPDFRAAHEIQLEQIGSLMMHDIENWVLRRDIQRLEHERRVLSSNNDKTKPPQGTATIVVTDIQGSTAMWEENPEVMQHAQDTHDTIIRRVCARHYGYEIDTEGDSFRLAFHGPVDAFVFALEAQMALFEAAWSNELLTMSNAEDDSGSFRGVRVRMGIHHGEVAAKRNEVTGRIMYEGNTYHLAKALEAMAHGGQIIACAPTWSLVDHFVKSALGSPQVVDLGSHVIPTNARSFQEGVTRNRIVQLVPRDLSYDYYAHRHLKMKPGPEVTPSPHNGTTGRQFHPIKSLKYICSSFHDAPYLDSKVTIAFVNVSEMAELVVVDEQKENMLRSKLAQLIEGLTERLGMGYLCHGDELLAFHDQNDAIRFGLMLRERLNNMDVLENEHSTMKLSTKLRYGSVHGTFFSMGPHGTSGRAQYTGDVVDEALEYGGLVDNGSVCCGVFNGRELNGLDGDILASFVGKRSLSGAAAGRGVAELSSYTCNWRLSRPQATWGGSL